MTQKPLLEGNIIHVRALELPWFVLFFDFFDFEETKKHKNPPTEVGSEPT
jgi:hypothetical protein